MTSEKTPREGYEVGYGRPPKHSRFQTGVSGNPGGRPRKSKQIEHLIQKELDEKIVIKEGGRDRTITKREAIIKQFVNRAIKGDSKPLQMMLAHLEKNREVEPFTPTEADDAALLKALLPSNVKEDPNG
jgi:hypothetical protein